MIPDEMCMCYPKCFIEFCFVSYKVSLFYKHFLNIRGKFAGNSNALSTLLKSNTLSIKVKCFFILHAFALFLLMQSGALQAKLI